MTSWIVVVEDGEERVAAFEPPAAEKRYEPGIARVLSAIQIARDLNQEADLEEHYYEKSKALAALLKKVTHNGVVYSDRYKHAQDGVVVVEIFLTEEESTLLREARS